MHKAIPDPAVRGLMVAQMMQTMKSSIVVTDTSGFIEYVNQFFIELTGYTSKDVVGHNVSMLSSGKTSPEVFRDLWDTITQGNEWRGEMCNKKKNGEYFWENVIVTVLRTNGVISHYIAIKHDNTEQKNANLLNQKNLMLLERTGRLARVGGWELDVKSGEQVWSDQIYHMLGLPEKPPLGKDLNFFTPESRAIFKDAVRLCIKKGTPYELELEVIDPAGKHYWVQTIGEAHWENGAVVTISGAVQDITDRKIVEKKLRKSERKFRNLSIMDDLTGLNNQRYFQDQLQVEIARANRYLQPLSIIVFDLDRFKSINDTYGHVEGNVVLARFGKLLRESLRDADTSYRYGGEEFVVMLPMTGAKEAAGVAEKIRNKFRVEKFVVGSWKFSATVSAGVAEYVPLEKADDFIKRADGFMYQAKDKGRDRVVFERDPSS